LVKIPERITGDGSAKIEDLFDQSFLATALDGKIFNSSNKKKRGKLDWKNSIGQHS
jgi:hypothetical protein